MAPEGSLHWKDSEITLLHSAVDPDFKLEDLPVDPNLPRNMSRTWSLPSTRARRCNAPAMKGARLWQSLTPSMNRPTQARSSSSEPGSRPAPKALRLGAGLFLLAKTHIVARLLEGRQITHLHLSAWANGSKMGDEGTEFGLSMGETMTRPHRKQTFVLATIAILAMLLWRRAFRR